MESKRSQESPPFARQEINDTAEIVAIDDLSNRLGFAETKELGEVRLRLVEAMRANNAEAVKVLIDQYLLSGEELISECQGDDFGRAQIGLSLAMAIIRRDAGRIDDYLDDLEDALEYAANEGYDDVAIWLRNALADALESAEHDTEL